MGCGVEGVELRLCEVLGSVWGWGVLKGVLWIVGVNLLVGVVAGGAASRWKEEWASMYDTCGHLSVLLGVQNGWC